MSVPSDEVSSGLRLTRRHAIVLLGFAVGASACRNEPAAKSPTNPEPTPTSTPATAATTPAPSTTLAPDPEPSTSPTSPPATVATTEPAPTTLAPTIACEDADESTAETTEGPYFSTGSPERSSLVEAIGEGTPFTLSGIVTDTQCTPVAQAKIELWHADPAGEYDNVGYRYRGHFFTADDGTFTVDTVKAGLYPGRTRHFHVKVQPTGGSALTTQLFWPDEQGNADDSIFDASLVMNVSSSAGSETGSFQFVV